MYSVSSKRWRVLSVGDVQTSLSVRWDGHHLKGDLRTNVRHRTMSSRWSGTRGTERRSYVHRLLRRRPTACQFQMFCKARLRNTYSWSGNGKHKSMLQTHGQVPRSDVSLHQRFELAANDTKTWFSMNQENINKIENLMHLSDSNHNVAKQLGALTQ